jgi:hypothetical protein
VEHVADVKWLKGIVWGEIQKHGDIMTLLHDAWCDCRKCHDYREWNRAIHFNRDKTFYSPFPGPIRWVDYNELVAYFFTLTKDGVYEIPGEKRPQAETCTASVGERLKNNPALILMRTRHERPWYPTGTCDPLEDRTWRTSDFFE